MAGQLHDDGFTMSHRVGAAKELLRRAYDINFDGVTWEQVESYWRAQRPIGWTEEDERKLQNELTSERVTAKHASPAASSPTTVEGPDERLEVPSSPLTDVRVGATTRLSPACVERRERTGKTAENKDLLAIIPRIQRTAMDIGGRASLPLNAETRFYGRDTNTTSPPIPSKEDAPAKAGAENIEAIEEPTYYECGPSDPDPTVDYFYEPLSPEDQAKFDEEDRREYGIFEEESSENKDNQPNVLRDVSNRLAQTYKGSSRGTWHSRPPQSARRQAQKSPPSAALN